jgi:hypothetical protein
MPVRVYAVETAPILVFWLVYGCTAASVGSDLRVSWRVVVKRVRRFYGYAVE